MQNLHSLVYIIEVECNGMMYANSISIMLRRFASIRFVLDFILILLYTFYRLVINLMTINATSCVLLFPAIVYDMQMSVLYSNSASLSFFDLIPNTGNGLTNPEDFLGSENSSLQGYARHPNMSGKQKSYP